MKTTFIISFVILVLYIFLVNIIAEVLVEERINYENSINGNSEINVGFMDKVTIEIKRPRWYGTIYETERISDLRVFGLFNIPIKVNGSNWGYYHLIVIILLGIFIKIKLKGGLNKWLNLPGESSSYSSYPT